MAMFGTRVGCCCGEGETVTCGKCGECFDSLPDTMYLIRAGTTAPTQWSCPMTRIGPRKWRLCDPRPKVFGWFEQVAGVCTFFFDAAGQPTPTEYIVELIETPSGLCECWLTTYGVTSSACGGIVPGSCVDGVATPGTSDGVRGIFDASVGTVDCLTCGDSIAAFFTGQYVFARSPSPVYPGCPF